MASNQYANKIIFGGQVLIDLTADDVLASDVLVGKKFHLPSGAPGTGTCTYDADTSDATAIASEILSGKTAYRAGAQLSGTMPNKGAQESFITTKTEKIPIAQGYHDGSGFVEIDSTEQGKLIASNIRNGVRILGVVGSYTGSGAVVSQSKSIMPSTVQQIILPDTGYNYLSQVTVEPIAYSETDNSAGGKTVMIATLT